MTPQQIAAIDSLRTAPGVLGGPLSQDQIDRLTPLVAIRNDADGAVIASEGLTRIEPRMLSERGVQSLPVLPRHYGALMDVLEQASVSTPAWFVPVLEALGVPTEDHAALTRALGSGYRWLLQDAGLDVGAKGTRDMLDIIAAGAPEAAPACAAAKALAVKPAPISVNAYSNALNEVV